MDNFALFLAGVVGLLLTPGPTNTLLATSGATVGFSRSLPLLVAELSGYLVSIALLEFVAGPLLSGLDVFGALLRSVAGAYLLFLSARVWKARLPGELRLISMRQVFVTTLLNPKSIVFALVLIPFASPRASRYVLTFVAVVPTIGSAWLAAGSLCARSTSTQYPNMIPKAASIVLAIFSLLLIYSAVFSATHSLVRGSGS